jgi:hypothetical protein
MIDRSGRLQLASLADEEIAILIGAVPGLAASWAGLIGTDIESFGAGQVHATAALRAAIATHNDQLTTALARIGLESILSVLDSAECDEDADEGTVELAAAAGREFGSIGAKWFLSAVATGSDALAREVADQLAELQAVAAESGSYGTTANSTAGSSFGGDVEMSNHSEAVASPAPPSDGADIFSLASLLTRTKELQEARIFLVSALREAIADIESGKPAENVGRSLDDWSTSVTEHLSNVAGIVDASDLDDLGQALSDLMDQARERDQKVRDALRGVRLLREQGLDHLVSGILDASGFESVGHLEAAAAALDIAAPADAAPGEYENQPAAAPAEHEDPARSAPIEHEDLTATAPVVEEDLPGEFATVEFALPVAAGPLAPEAPFQAGEPPVPEAPPADELHEEIAPGNDPAAETSPPAGERGGETGGTPAKPGEPIAARDTMPAADEALAAFPELDFPWELGKPPVLATLVSEQKFAAAVCVAEAAGERPARQQLLRLLCAAFSCAPTALELQLPELSPAEAEVEQMKADECRVLLAAALRAGLVLGYSPVGLPSLIDRAELGGNGSRAVIEAAAEAVKRGYRRDIEAEARQNRDLPREWAAFKAEALGLSESLAHSKVNLQRASQVLHHIVSKDQPVGAALIAVAELSADGVAAAAVEAHPEKWADIEQLAKELSGADTRARIITKADRAISTKAQLRRRIVGGAWAKLDASLREVAELFTSVLSVRSAIRLSSRPADLETASELFRALELEHEPAVVTSVGAAALRQLSSWLRSAVPAAEAVSVDDLIRVELEPLYEIPRDKDGSPTRGPDLAEVREILQGRDQLQVMRGYLETGNVAAARRIIAAADGLDAAALDDEIACGRRDAQNRHQQESRAVDRVAARLRAVYDDEAARELTERAEPFRATTDDRFDLAIGPLRALAAQGADQLGTFRDDLSERARALAGRDADRQRILDLIEHQDEVLAVEFLTMAEAGLELPVANEQHGDDFSGFFPAMVNAALTASRAGRDAVEAVRTAAGATAGPRNRLLADGLEAWRGLKTDKRGFAQDRFLRRVADVLRMIGLVPWPQNWIQELSRTQRSGFATFKVRAAPVDRSYVPSLGTQAGQTYDLTLVWDAVTPMRLMDFIEESRRTQANIILYFNTLEPDDRLTLRRQTRYDGGKGFSPVVVDEPVIGWLSTRAEPGWRFTQRLTLPFTTIHPYAPFAAGEVPDEVFVGREAERQAIEDPTASMFVYGGRQLGKSALLRRVERLFTESPPSQAGPRTGHVAVYLDLKAASIGEAQEPAALWTVLARQLEDRGVLSRRSGPAAGPDAVIKQLSRWLDADDGNRLLLLLDEADNFLTADSQAGRGAVGGEFPTLQRLKGLMAESGRRFKAVFAGLHQVQRFHDSSNTPVAHGGNDILVGPLGSLDAYHLVADPMSALGYTFESPDLVWRLLLLTNYQASLVQIVCEALVRELSRRDLPRGGGRIVITVDDVESVYAKREVKDLIVQRFRWTINLDSRYRVIALVVALQSLDSEPGETFTPEDLHVYCEASWPIGFGPGVLSDKEFERYLNEMVGLGVLHRQGEDRYGLRSPNILSLLGDRSSLERELGEAPRQLELQYEYNPTMNRRNLGHSTELGARRSPLTDQDIAALLGQDGSKGARVKIVTGSPALAIDRAARVIQDVAVEQQIPCDLIQADSAGSVLASTRKRRHLIVDVSGDDVGPDALTALCAGLAGNEHVTATVVTGPRSLPLPAELVQAGAVISARRWSIEGLRSWYESPFNSPGLRKRLYRVTSGWPLLVEATMREIDRGKSPDDALDRIVQRLSDRVYARDQLAACGIDEMTALRWAASLAVTGNDGLDEAFPANVEELTEILKTGASEVLERLLALDLVESTEDGWVLDRAVLAAAMALRT